MPIDVDFDGVEEFLVVEKGEGEESRSYESRLSYYKLRLYYDEFVVKRERFAD